MSIKLKLEGFDELLKKIEKAGGNVDKVAEECLKDSAQVLQDELKYQMRKANVPEKLIDAMPAPEIENDWGAITARVGYRKGAYDPKNPSDGYKVVFLNYGTPHRTKHGQVEERQFIQKAKKRAGSKIRKQQEKALQDALKELEK